MDIPLNIQYELLISWDFDKMKQLVLLHGAADLNSEDMLNAIFSISIDDVVIFLKEENVKESQDYSTAESQDGFWINCLDEGYELINQERGMIYERVFYDEYEDLLKHYACILLNKIPKNENITFSGHKRSVNEDTPKSDCHFIGFLKRLFYRR